MVCYFWDSSEDSRLFCTKHDPKFNLKEFSSVYGNPRAKSGLKSCAVLCCTVERLCLHCAVLRVAPSTHVAESKAQQCIRLWPAEPHNSANLYLSDHYYHPPDHHHYRGRRRLHPPPPAQPHTSSLATGSIATGDEERGGGVCVCVYVCSLCKCIRACICVAASHLPQQFVSRRNSPQGGCYPGA